VIAVGKWCQQKKRGTSSDVGLVPPPAPFVHETAGDLIQDATGLDDTGGLLRLFEGPTEWGPWTLYGQVDWDPSWDWGAVVGFTGPYIVATETGNGLTYAGESPPSDAFAL